MLARDAAAIIPNSGLRHAVENALIQLLNMQYVSSPLIHGRLWKIVEGAGMGLVYSGSTADAAFYSKVETWACSADVMRQHKIHAYFRFKDDIWVLSSCRELMTTFFHGMKQRSEYFELICTEVSRTAIDMLQVTVIRNVGTGQFTCKPIVKDLGPPLDLTSGQPSSTLFRWPAACIRSLNKLSTVPKYALDAKKTFITRFERHHCPKEWIDLIASTEIEARSANDAPFSDCKWLVLPYHSVWQKAGIASTLRDFKNDPSWNSIINFCGGQSVPDFCVAWKNQERHAHVKISTLANHFLGRMEKCVSAACTTSPACFL